jgi:hypothetical protein
MEATRDGGFGPAYMQAAIVPPCPRIAVGPCQRSYSTAILQLLLALQAIKDPSSYLRLRCCQTSELREVLSDCTGCLDTKNKSVNSHVFDSA